MFQKKFSEIQENQIRYFNEIRKTINGMNEKFNRDHKITEILEIKKSVNEVKNKVDRLNN
jgi:hypothetical protein